MIVMNDKHKTSQQEDGFKGRMADIASNQEILKLDIMYNIDPLTWRPV